jgi:hypothetical protein
VALKSDSSGIEGMKIWKDKVSMERLKVTRKCYRNTLGMILRRDIIMVKRDYLMIRTVQGRFNGLNIRHPWISEFPSVMSRYYDPCTIWLFKS